LKKIKVGFRIAATAFALTTISGCKTCWIDATVQNQTGETVHEVEVDYPTASFGANLIAPARELHYRFQIRGSGPVKVEYTFEDGRTVHALGPNLSERQKGQLAIKLLPRGKVDFVPNLEPAS